MAFQPSCFIFSMMVFDLWFLSPFNLITVNKPQSTWAAILCGRNEGWVVGSLGKWVDGGQTMKRQAMHSSFKTNVEKFHPVQANLNRSYWNTYVPKKKSCITIQIPLLSQISCEIPFRDLTGGEKGDFFQHHRKEKPQGKNIHTIQFCFLIHSHSLLIPNNYREG